MCASKRACSAGCLAKCFWQACLDDRVGDRPNEASYDDIGHSPIETVDKSDRECVESRFGARLSVSMPAM